MPEHRIYV